MLNYDKLSRSNEEANSLSKEDVIEIEGIVREAMPNAIFKVEMLSEDKNTGKLTPSGHILLAHISGKLRTNFIRILPGDKVTLMAISSLALFRSSIAALRFNLANEY